MAEHGKQNQNGVAPKKKRKSRAKESKENKPDDNRQLTSIDFDYILDWLESPDNQAKIEGTKKNPKIGARPLTKLAGFRELAAYVNSQPKNTSLPHVSGESMKGRWKYFFDKYREVKKESNVTGFGITKEDKENGILSIEVKLTSMFEHYHRMDKLYGAHPNVIPEARHTSMFGIEPSPNEDSEIANEELDPLFTYTNVTAPNMPLDDPGTPTAEQSPLVDPMAPTEETSNLEKNDSPKGDVCAAASEVNAGRPNNEGGRQKIRTSHSVQKRPRATRDDRTSNASDSREPTSENVDAGNESDYPPPKKIIESRHSMNTAFAYSLGDLNDSRIEANKLNKERWQRDDDYRRKVLEEEKLNKSWEQDFQERKFGQETKDREKDRVDRARTNKQHFMVSLMNASQGRSMEEIMLLIKEAEKGPNEEPDRGPDRGLD